MIQILKEKRKYLFLLISIFLTILSVYFVFKSISEFVNYRITQEQVANTITLSGHGEVNAVPDIANISFSIHKEAKTVKDAQNQVAVVEKKALDFLKANGIENKDIKTSDASFYPKYEYQQAKCPPIPMGAETSGITTSSSAYYCPPDRSIITGYEVNESITVKIRNTEKVGEIMQGLGGLGVTELNGPNFAIDDEDFLQAEARKEAIDDAKSKAKVLAKDLGVHLGHIVSFSENGYYPMPMYDMAKTASIEDGSGPIPAEIPKGENTITSDVNITFQIR